MHLNASPWVIISLLALTGCRSIENPSKMPLDQTKRRTILSAESGTQTRICFSNDGDIWMSGLRGEHPEKVASPGENPKWSPDGKHIAYEGIEAGIYTVEIGTMNTQRLSTFGHRPQWSPDGKNILFLDDQNYIYVITSDGEDERMISDYPQVTPPDPQWTRDSQGVFAVCNDFRSEGQSSLLRLPIFGRNEQLEGVGPYISVSPDERIYAMVGDLVHPEGQYREMFLAIDKVGQKPQSISNSLQRLEKDQVLYCEPIITPKQGFWPACLMPPVWSPSGRYMAVVRNISSVPSKHPKGSQDVLLFTAMTHSKELRFYPDPEIVVSDQNLPFQEETEHSFMDLAWAESDAALIVSAVQSYIRRDAKVRESGTVFRGKKALTRTATSDERILALDRLLLVEKVADPLKRRIIDIGSGHSVDVWEPHQH